MVKSNEDERVRPSPAVLASSEAHEGASLIGEVLGGQYEIVEVVGEGGIGVVYRARQLTVGRDVAIKILKKQFAKDELASRRFEVEAAAIARLRHPNTLRLYDCQRTTDGDLYLVTEHLTGHSLSDVLRREGRLPLERSLRIFDEICRSLGEAHTHGIVHRDLKPANIFLDRVGSEDLVKVLDFGIAKLLQGGGGLTRAGTVPGTPQYMSPEQAQAGRIDHRADIYALGVILFQLVSGRPPFDGPSAMEILGQHITEEPPTLESTAPGLALPEGLEHLIRWMLEKTPDRRPQNVEAIREQLPDILAKVAAPKAGPPPPIPVRSPQGAIVRWRWFSVLTGSLGVVAGVLVGLALAPSPTSIPASRTVTLPTAPFRAEVLSSPSPELPPNRATIVSKPSGALVLAADGTVVGSTPLDVDLKGPAKYSLRGENGHRGAVVLDAERDAGRTVQVVLEGPRPAPEKSARDRKRRSVSDRKRKH